MMGECTSPITTKLRKKDLEGKRQGNSYFTGLQRKLSSSPPPVERIDASTVKVFLWIKHFDVHKIGRPLNLYAVTYIPINYSSYQFNLTTSFLLSQHV